MRFLVNNYFTKYIPPKEVSFKTLVILAVILGILMLATLMLTDEKKDKPSKDLGRSTSQTAKPQSMIFNGNEIFMNMEKELVYLFLYNPMICTSAWTTQSVHKTRKSAELAMEEHKSEAQLKWEQDFITPEERMTHPFGKFEDWRITAMVLEG